MNGRLRALSIGRAAHEHLRRGFAGRVLGSFPRACNLATDDGVVVCLVTPAVGEGPLNVVLEAHSLPIVDAGTPAIGTDVELQLGGRLQAHLDGAAAWEATIAWGGPGDEWARGLEMLDEFLLGGDSLRPRIRKPAGSGDPAEASCNPPRLPPQSPLLAALQARDRPAIVEHAVALAGLGPGLTPAGDDFLIGLMAGLRAWPEMLRKSELTTDQACSLIAEAAAPRTTTLAAALLQTAAGGMFAAPWHELAAALASGTAAKVNRAAGRILAIGATSGADALAGFTSPYRYWKTNSTSP